MNHLYSLNRKQNWVITEAFANKIRKTKKRGDHCLLIKKLKLPCSPWFKGPEPKNNLGAGQKGTINL